MWKKITESIDESFEDCYFTSDFNGTENAIVWNDMSTDISSRNNLKGFEVLGITYLIYFTYIFVLYVFTKVMYGLKILCQINIKELFITI